MKLQAPYLFSILLLTLLLSCPLYSQFLDEEDLSFIREHSHPVYKTLNDSSASWDLLVKEFKDHQIICLGEFNHGTHEVFAYRNELIRAIDSTFGIDLILFESGLGEIGCLNLGKDSCSTSGMLQGFFGGWRSKEFLELMRFIQSSEISIGGFDVQRTGSVVELYMPKELKRGFSNTEKEFVALKSKLVNYKTSYDSVRTATEELQEEYEKYASLMDSTDLLLQRTMRNRVEFLQYMLEFCQTKDWQKRWKARDSIMAENFLWLLDYFKPTGKVVVIGHNYHLAKYNSKEEVMGEFLGNRLTNKLYVLGVFGNEGSYLNNSGAKEEMSSADNQSLDIKHVIKATGWQCSFITTPEHRGLTDGFLHENLKVHDSFTDLSGTDMLNPALAFDAILLINRISPALH